MQVLYSKNVYDVSILNNNKTGSLLGHLKENVNWPPKCYGCSPRIY